MSDLLDHLDLENAAIMEAKLGPLKHAISVENIKKNALGELKAMDKLPQELYLVNKADLEENLKSGIYNKHVIVENENSIRVTKIPANPLLGADARDRELERLERRISKISEILINIEIDYENLTSVENKLIKLSQSQDFLFTTSDEERISELNASIDELTDQSEELSETLENLQDDYDGASEELNSLRKLEHLAYLLDRQELPNKLINLEGKLKKLTDNKARYESLISKLPLLISSQKHLNFSPEDPKEKILDKIDAKELEKKKLTSAINSIDEFMELKDYLRYEKSAKRLNTDSSLTQELQKKKMK